MERKRVRRQNDADIHFLTTSSIHPLNLLHLDAHPAFVLADAASPDQEEEVSCKRTG